MGVSIWQVLIILAIVLIIFGPSRIPGLGKSLGEAIRGFKKGISDDEIDVTETAKSEQIDESNTNSKTKKETSSAKHKS